MIDSDFKILPLLGSLALLVGLIGALTALSQGNSATTTDTKTWKELRSELESDEGERIIGEQWKKPPPLNGRSAHD
jgi:hypothetical protein